MDKELWDETNDNLIKITSILYEELEGVEPRNPVHMVGQQGTKRSTCGFLQRIYNKTDDDEINETNLKESTSAYILIYYIN